MRRIIPVLAALLVLAPSAEAKVWCTSFNPPGCEQMVATAQNAADLAADGDTVLLGPGNNGPVETDRILTWVGGASSGPSASQLNGNSADPEALILRRGGTLRSLSFEAAAATTGHHGLVVAPTVPGTFSLTLDDVNGFGGDLTANDVEGPGDALVVEMQLGQSATVTIRNSAFDGGDDPGDFRNGDGASLTGALAMTASGSRFGQPGNGTGLTVFARGIDARLERVVAQGDIGAVVANGTLTANRSLFRGDDAAVGAIGQTTPGRLTLRNSQVIAGGSSDSKGVLARSIMAEAAIDLIGTTVFVPFGAGAVEANRDAATSPASRVRLRNSIARVATPSPGGADLLATDGGVVEAASSSFSSRQQTGGGTATAPGSGSNLSGDPLFANAGAGDLHLLAGSPLVDRGDPALLVAGDLAFDGAARSLDGSADGLALPDIGAFESPARPNLIPVLSEVGLTNRVFAPVRAAGSQRRRARRPRRGTTFRYTLSEAARVTIVIERRAKGRRVRGRCRRPARRNRNRPRCVRWVRATTLSADEAAGAQESAFSGRRGRRPLPAGRYRARISATDIAGATSPEQRRRFRIVRG